MLGDLLPSCATPSERAMVNAAGERVIPNPIKHLWSPYNCPADLLPWLAFALSVDQWDSTWPETTKRQAIAASVENHRIKGTVAAVVRAIQRTGYDVEINERTGEAYVFNLRVKISAGGSAGGSVTNAAIATAERIALETKNARSEMGATQILADTDITNIFIGGVTISGEETQIQSA